MPRLELTDPLEADGVRGGPGAWQAETLSRGPSLEAVGLGPSGDALWTPGAKDLGALPPGGAGAAAPSLGPATASALSYTEAPVSHAEEEEDDRSWWARWNSSLLGISISVQSFNVLMVAAFTRLPRDISGWDQPRFKGLRYNFTRGPRVDNDRYMFNWVAHPLAGSEYYMIGRNRGLGPWEGLAYAAAMSAFFEFFVESVYEQASWQDLWITPVAGMVLGELRWQAKKALEDPSTGKPRGTVRKILYVILDPLDPIYNL